MTTAPKTGLPIVNYLDIASSEPHLVANACDRCGARFLDRRNACAACGGRALHPSKLATSGIIRTFTVVHRAVPGVAVPFVSVIVDLDGGGTVKANLVGAAGAGPEILGRAVALTTFVAATDAQGTDAVAFGFELVGS